MAVLLTGHGAFAGPLGDRIRERLAARHPVDALEDESWADGPASLGADIRVIRDISYGSDASQRFDVYAPKQAVNAPVIFMVHGGGWRRGDKAAQSVVQNKVAHWVPMGFILVSTNYRMLPGADPLQQAQDVARAVAAAQKQAGTWGGDPKKFILMGHSAGAHLVALLATAPRLSSGIVSAPWLGTVCLDSAALDVVKIMESPHFRLYDDAFGRDPEYWKSVSPYHAITGEAHPILAVCSARRADSVQQSERFAAKASSVGVKVTVLKEDLSHREINERLGEDKAYTAGVEAFLAGLDPAVAGLLGRQSGDQLWNQLSAEERAASAQFQKEGNRRAPWNVLEKKLTKGVPAAFVERLLGKPESIQNDGTVWLYTLYYGSFVRVEFDKEMKLKEVTDK